MRLLLILLFVCSMSQAQKPVYTLDTNRQLHHLGPFAEVLVDSFDHLEDDAILKGNYDLRFVPLTSLKAQKPKSSYWLRCSIQSRTKVNNWVLLVPARDKDHLYNDKIEAFIVSANHQLLASDRAGPLIKRSKKTIKAEAGLSASSFSLPEGETVFLYVKVSNSFSGAGSLSEPVIQHPSMPIPVHDNAQVLRILNVIAIVFCILSFFFYLFVKEKAYLYFSFYTLVLSQHYLILHPLTPFVDFYIPEHPELLAGFWNILTFGGFILFCLFGRSFINLRTLASNIDKWFRIFLASWAFVVICNTLFLFFEQRRLTPFLVDPILGIVCIGFFIRFAFFKSILTKLFVLGALWLIFFTTLGLLLNNGVIDLPFNPWPIGQVGQLLIYAAALAYKVRLNERARAEANRIKDMDEIKSRFFANISHEFRTPLTLIQGPLQQIESSAAGSKDIVSVPVRHIKTMRRNTDRLLELVNQLLDLSKLDSGKMGLQMIRGDVTQLLKALTASFESVAERKGIHYQVHFPDHSSICFFDKDKLEKIVSNLLANAFKYTPEGGTVSVAADLTDERLRFSVEDSGPGIPKNEFDKIFDRFYQMEGSEEKGSGIGLALVKELVTLYRGQISLNSEPGKGSRFRVTLPVSKTAFRDQELVYGQWKSAESYSAPLHDERADDYNIQQKGSTHLPLLLVIEDNDDLRRFICETVAKHYNVIEAVNGQEGLQKATTEIPDIIISDVMMPVMDGFEFTEKVKNDDRTSHIPVILLTAKAGQAHKLEGLGTGADDYLVKPFDAPELLMRLQNLVNQRKLLRRKFAGGITLRPTEVAVKTGEEVFLQKLMAAIEANMSEDDFGVEELAKALAMSRSQLHRKLVAITGHSPSDILRNTRLLRAKELLQKKSATPSEVAFQVGFNSHAYFSKCFKEEFGISPSEI